MMTWEINVVRLCFHRVSTCILETYFNNEMNVFRVSFCILKSSFGNEMRCFHGFDLYTRDVV